MSNVIPGGWVQFLDKMGDDLDVVNSARISFSKKHEVIKKGDAELIDFLLRNRHGTPFEMVEFMFQVRCPLTVAREWFRHRIASYNEVSGRYVKQQNDNYIPEISAVRIQTGKPGNYHYEPMEDLDKANRLIDKMVSAYEFSYETYEELLTEGMAKELARNVLCQGMFTEFRFKVNARALMNFLSLRNAPNAMFEIQQYAKKMEEYFKAVLPLTHAAFIKHGRVAP